MSPRRGIVLRGQPPKPKALPPEFLNDYLAEVLRHPCRCEFPCLYGPSPQYGCASCLPPGVYATELRRRLVRRYAYAIPNGEALLAIAAWSPIVEIGAGTGYWAALLRAIGADVGAYDAKPGHNTWCAHDPYTTITVGGPEDAASHGDRTLLLCWPPYEEDMATRALDAYPGQRLAYIGEHEGGCCADDVFFARLRDWDETGCVEIPQWWGCRDALWLYERRRPR